MDRTLGLRLLTLPLIAIAAATAQPAAAQDYLTMFPASHGRFAPGGDCAHMPRVAIGAKEIRLETSAGTAAFARPDFSPNFMGPEDQSLTYTLQGPGEGLIVSIDRNRLWTSGGEHLGAVERAVEAVAGKMPLRRCGAQLAAPAPMPAPRMRATAATSVAALAAGNLMLDPGFKTAYLRALGPLKREEWPITMEGPGEQHAVTVAGSAFVEISTCKPHDCGDNAMVVIYRPKPQALWGMVTVRRRTALIGNPPPAVTAELRRLFKAAWPNG